MKHTFPMAVAAGTAVANIYYNQPLLGLIQTDFGPDAARLVPVLTQLGYASNLIWSDRCRLARESRSLVAPSTVHQMSQ